MDAPVLYESPDVLAVDKPPGVVVIPAREGDPEATLRRSLERARNEALWVVHRIDRDTSGVVLFARTAAAHRALSLDFEHRRVTKRYLALTRGALPASSGVIAISLHTARKGKMRPAERNEADALHATTEYTVQRQWETPVGTVCLVEALPRTGRQHQIRVHFRALGAPLLVDGIYGRAARVTAAELGLGPATPGCERLTLHAASLTFPSPAVTTGETITVTAPLAPDLAALITALDKASAAR